MSEDDGRARTAEYQIGALDRALRVLEVLASVRSASLSELVPLVEMPKGSLVRHLRVLARAGYVTMDSETKLYSLGPALIALGHAARSSHRIAHVALPTLRALRERFDESAHLGILLHDEVVHIAVSASRQKVKMAVPVGERTAVHVSALGKALIAWMPDQEITAIVERKGLRGFTEHTITDVPSLIIECETIRLQGWAEDDEESEHGLRCVAAPIRDVAGEVVAALSISGPVNRMSTTRIPEITDAVVAAGLALSRDIGWRPGAVVPAASARPRGGRGLQHA